MNASNQRISHQAAHSKFGRNSICTTTKVILYSILLSGSSFYAGLFLGMHHSFQNLPYSDLDGTCGAATNGTQIVVSKEAARTIAQS